MNTQFGLEIEYFILKPPGPPGIEDIQQLFRCLSHSFGYTINIDGEPGEPRSVGRMLPNGLLSIKMDMCTHILELSFPPFRNVEAFTILYEKVKADVHNALDLCSITLYTGAFMYLEPAQVRLFPASPEQEKRITQLINRHVPERPFSLRLFMAYMCATQVHLDLDPGWFYNSLPRLYEFEYLIPLLFSNSQVTTEPRVHCIRPLLYRDGLPEGTYAANAFPCRIPTSEHEYNLMLTSTENFVRDYSFIRTTSYNTVEFRSCCSLDSVESIIEMIALRLGIWLVAQHKHEQISHPDSRSHFYQVCCSGSVNQQLLDFHVCLLKDVSIALPPPFCRPLLSLLDRIKLTSFSHNLMGANTCQQYPVSIQH